MSKSSDFIRKYLNKDSDEDKEKSSQKSSSPAQQSTTTAGQSDAYNFVNKYNNEDFLAQVSSLSKAESYASEAKDRYARVNSPVEDWDMYAGKRGWESYTSETAQRQQALTQEEDEKKWWEKLLGYLGEVQDTTLPTGYVQKVIDDVREDTTYREPNDEWTNGERYIFGYLYQTDKSQAYHYAASVNEAINKEKEEEQLKKIAESAADGFWSGAAHTAGAIATAPLGIADYLSDLVYANAGKPIRSDGTVSPFEYSQAVTGGISENLNEKYGTLNEKIPVIGGRGLGDVYGLGTSIAQSALAGYTGGLSGTLVQFFGTAAAAGVDDAKQRGATDEQALQIGTLNGIAEGLAEMIGVNNLLKIGSSATMRQLMKNLVKQGAAEGIEEGLTTLMNNFADQLVMKDKSNFNALVRQFMANGMSEEEAKKKAWLIMANDLAFDVVAGFASGVAHAGPQTVTHTVIENVYQPYQTGKAILESEGSVDALKQLANEVAGVSSADTHQAISDQIGKVDEKASALRVGKLYDTVYSANNQANASANQADIAKSLERKGFDSQKAKAVAEALVAKYNGQELTKAQEKTLASVKGNTDVKAAISNIVTNAKSTMGQRSDNIRNFNKGISEGIIRKAFGIDSKAARKAEEKQFTPEGTYETSADGKSIRTDTGDIIEIKGVASISKGEMLLDIGDGNTINAKDVSFASKDLALVYEAVASIGDNVDANTANKLIQQFKGGNAMVFARGMAQAYTYGFYGYHISELMGENSLATELTQEQRNYAYNLGSQYRNIKDKADKAKAHTTKATGAKGVCFRSNDGTMTDFRSYEKDSNIVLKDVQKTAIDVMERLSNIMGVRFNVFESWVENGTRYYLDENGVKTKGNPNGFYDPRTGEIYIDLNAGNGYEGVMLFTVAHELTHFMRQWSPEHFTQIAKIVFKHGGMKGHVSELVAAKQAKAKAKGKPISYDRAMEECVADGMETILKNGKVVEFMADVKQKDHQAWEKIKEWFKKLADLLKDVVSAYSAHSAQTLEGRNVASFAEDLLRQIEQIYAEGAVEAGDTFRAAQEQFSTDSIRGNAEGAVAQSEVTTALTESDGVMNSDRTEFEALPKQMMNLSTGAGTLLHSIEGLIATKIKGLSGKTINGYTGRDVRGYAMGISGFTKAQIKEVNKFMDAMADFMEKAGVTYKFIGLQDVKDAKLHYTYNADGSIKTIVLSAMVKNGDYPVNFDLSSICKKRVAMSKLIDNLARRGSLDSGTVKLTPANIFKINTALKNAGYETACLGCFVESKRYNSLEWANKFCNKWNAAVKKVNPNATYFGYGNATFNEDSFTLEQAMKIDAAANKYITATKTERLGNALAKYRAKEESGLPLVESFSKAARERLMKADISEELKTKYLNSDVTTLNMADVEFLLENGILPGATLSNKQAVTELVKSGEAYQHLLRPSDLLTDRGISKLEALPNFHGVLYGHYGSGTPKLMQSYTPYNSEIALLPNKKGDQSLAEYLYTIAGVRMQSFSDFQIQNIYDYLQMVADLAARKVPAHAYTKEISFAKLLGMTGIKVNLSVMFDIDPMVDKAHAGLTKLNKLVHRGEYAKVVLEDAQGKWVYNIGDYQTQKLFAEAYPDEAKRFLQSIGFADAVKLQSSTGYSANCGIIGVGYSDLGIFAMLDDNRIRYIIPYHASSLPAEIKLATHIALGTDYTPYQNNMKIKEIVDRNGNKVNWTIKEAYKRLGSGQAVINELNEKVRKEGWVVSTTKAQTGHGTYGLYENLQETNDPRQTASNFMDWCIGNSTLPLFYQFASHENYYKLLYDYNVYDCVTEEYAPQQAVTNTYPTMVDGEVQPGTVTDGGFDAEYLQGTIDKQMAFMDAYNSNLDEDLERLADSMEDGTLFSDRVSDQETLAFLNEQLRNGEVTEVYRAMAVDADGNLYPPMAGYVTKNGKKVINGHPSAIGVWEQSTESIPWESVDEEFLLGEGFKQYAPTKEYPNGRFERDNNIFYKNQKGEWKSKFRLEKDNGTTVDAAYAPYIHTSLSMLNDQFTSAYKRENLVVVRGYVPNSEVHGVNGTRYQANFADKPVGRTKWHSGVVAAQMPETRTVILSRYFMPIEIVDDAVMAQKTKEMMKGKDIEIPYNVVTPRQRRAMEKIGIRIGEARGLKDAPKKADVMYSDRDYSYEALVSKPDMVVTEVGGNVPTNRADVAHMAKQNAATVGKFDPKTGSVSVHVDDIGTDVILSTKGLRHGLRRTQDPLDVPNYIVTVKAGEILKNSIRINEITPSDANAKSSYVLLGAAKDANGTYVVRFVVNHFDNSVTAMDVLYAINAKKEPAALKAPRLTAKPLSVTGSSISIADLLDLVNQYFPDILPEDVLKHYGYDARPEGDLGEDALYSDRDNVPTFYSQMAKVIEGVKQEKLGASSVVSMLRGKGVKAEEIKWSGIEDWLDGKKSVTKAELQEFIAGSMLQIEEETLTNDEIPYTDDQQKRITEHTAKRDEIAQELAEVWKQVTGDDFPIQNVGAGLESAVESKIRDVNLEKKKASFEGRLLEKLRKDLKEVIANNDDFGFDSWKEVLISIHRNRKSFVDHYEMSAADKAVIVKYCNALNAYNEVPNAIDDLSTGRLRRIAHEAELYNRKIGDVRSEHYAENAKHMTKWGQYKLKGGENYREILFKIPGSYYYNDAMAMHWDERDGVLAHARIQDLNTFLGKMLFVEEIQSDWHNEGHKEGYDSDKEAALKKIAELRKQWDSLYNEMLEASAAEARAISGKMDAIDTERASLAKKVRNDNFVPDAPFKDNYHEYVLKRLLREAAEQDYDSIGWTTAETQDERWANNRPHKEGEGKSGFLKGYTIEYDQDIPKFLNKYGKKWGTRVGKTTLDSGTEVWSMAITDEMKESVLTEGQPLYQDRDTDSVSNRSLLANAFEGVAKDDLERNKIREYKGQIDLINAEERKLSELNEKIRELSFAKGPKDTKAIRDLQFEARQTANRINTYDKILLRLEASKPLQDVLAREKKLAYQKAEKQGKEALAAYKERAAKTQRELMDRWQESRKRGIESREKTFMRHKIQRVVGELNQLLLSNDKKRHVPDSLKKAVADALALVNMDTVGAEERAAKYAALIAKETDPDKIASYTETMENILRQGDKMGQRLKELRDAYEEIQDSDDPDIANAYDPVIAGSLKELAGSIGNTSLRNMTIEQLSDVYDMYKMVLTRVRDANKSFLNEKKEAISALASRVVGEVRVAGGEHKMRVAMLDPVRKFLWNNLKPVYAFAHMGSDTLTEAFNTVRKGEDVWAVDVTEAREYYLDKSKKYGYDSWDFKKKYRFESGSGLEFELTLDQILSLYAYSKREQAHEHLKLGGFVFDSNIETYKEQGSKLIKYKVNTADAHQITPDILANIISNLSGDQKGFVDEMQDYLSTVMGAKGNEITMKMYGVKLFKEKFYFPLKSAKQFMFEQNEVSGEVRIKNSGFTNKVVAHANNPVILSNFMDVWSGHVNDMSMYHAFVLPLEDFNRIFNYNSPKLEGQPPVSVKGTIQSAYTPAAVGYVKQLITDLNGGARSDPATDILNKLMGLFKKGSVFASLSVVVQQPSAMARAAALVDTKYFIGPKVDHKRHKALWDEVKKYAPVAIIKEMGYFDTNMGKSTQDFIQGKEYSGFKEKMKALVTDSGYRDEVLSKAPALADELAWCSIWEAVKREMHDKHSGLDVNSEPFLMLCGSRFTEVITKTQVYDSVLSRSALMRSKDTGLKMATVFMAEPTTSINMIADALLQGKRGNRKYCRAAIGAVIASQILNSILVSFVYAGRDDDEDETYAEKYIGTLTGEILDSLNPGEYIPFIKDIVSIAKGYDVERSDMAVFSDLVNAYKKLGSDKLSVYRKVEGFAGSIAQILGLPVKNIMRDARGIYQTIDSFVNGEKTTGEGIGYAVKEALPGWMGGGDTSNQQQLYEAIVNGDQAHISRVKSRFKDQSAINSAIRNALRENDPRIREAAQAQINGDPSERVRIARLIIADGFIQDDVVAAINSEITALTKSETTTSTQKASGLYKVSDFATEIANGDYAAANAAKTDIIRTAQKNGKTAEEAEKAFNSDAKSALKELFVAGEISEAKAVSALTDYCGIEEQDAMADVQYWSFKKNYPDVYADDAWFDKYNKEIADHGIDIVVYMNYRNEVKNITGDGKKDRRMDVIHSLPITKAQKDAMYFAEGWAASTLHEAPWH